ncbi:MAG: hypothetical protein ACK5MY_02840 [Jhaorihella sp.]
MQVIFHTGAHCTDEDLLLKCLLRNKEDFSKRGIAVPGPGRYRALLKDAFAAMDKAAPAPDARDVLIDAILDEEVADRLIMSNEHFFGSQRFAIEGNILYPLAGERLGQLRALFPFDQIELFMAIRSPAGFMPLVLAKAAPKRVREVLDTTDPRSLRWSETLTRIRDAVPDIPLTVWCNEDTPLIWGQILREIAGIEHGQTIAGGFDILYEIMSREGIQRFRRYLAEHPEMSEMQRRRVVVAFLDKYAIEDAVEEELDLPGWTLELVEEMTELYDEDILRIQRIPGVQMIAP